MEGSWEMGGSDGEGLGVGQKDEKDEKDERDTVEWEGGEVCAIVVVTWQWWIVVWGS